MCETNIIDLEGRNLKCMNRLLTVTQSLFLSAKFVVHKFIDLGLVVFSLESYYALVIA